MRRSFGLLQVVLEELFSSVQGAVPQYEGINKFGIHEMRGVVRHFLMLALELWTSGNQQLNQCLHALAPIKTILARRFQFKFSNVYKIIPEGEERRLAYLLTDITTFASSSM